MAPLNGVEDVKFVVGTFIACKNKNFVDKWRSTRYLFWRDFVFLTNISEQNRKVHLMKRLAIFAAALLALTALASESFGFQPTISLQYGGETVALQAASTANADGTTDWSFVTPDGKLAVCVNLKKEPGYPAYRMTSRVKNLSTTEETDVVSSLRVFASEFSLPSADSSVTLNTLLGSECKPQDFEPVEFVVDAGEEKVLEIRSGRSSSELCPTSKRTSAPATAGSLRSAGPATGAPGSKTPTGANRRAGDARTNFKLLPGESSATVDLVLRTDRHDAPRIQDGRSPLYARLQHAP